jgi:hypothetical protein
MPAELPTEERITRAADWLRIRGFTPLMALELRLAAQVGAPGGGT